MKKSHWVSYIAKTFCLQQGRGAGSDAIILIYNDFHKIMFAGLHMQVMYIHVAKMAVDFCHCLATAIK